MRPFLRLVDEQKFCAIWGIHSWKSPKISEKEMTFLTLEQIRLLLAELEKGRNADAVLIAKICQSTGARWSKAEGLRVHQVRDGMLHLSGAKSGKNRSVPICEDLPAELMKVAAESMTGRLFKYAGAAFRHAVIRAELEFPQGQMTHVLRHSFASHFMMNGGEYSGAAKTAGTFKSGYDYAICLLGAGSPSRGESIESYCAVDNLLTE